MSLSDYSSKEKEIRSTPEMKILPKGSEVHARITFVAEGISDKEDYNGAKWLRFTFDVPDDPMVKEFGDFLWDPLTEDKILNQKTVQRNRDKFNRFTKCFGIDLSKPFSWGDDIPGKMGWVILGQQEDDYGLKNNVTKYVLGQGAQQATSLDEDAPF
jgi:hypothetical protein